MTVYEYRKKHKRCATCVHSEEHIACWFCRAKQKKYSGSIFYTRVKGMFCPMYEPMQGCHRDLEKLKPIIEKLYDENIFFIDYWVSDCGYHGWEWDKDDGRLKSQKDITEGIRQKFIEIYALILSGLGEKCEE